MKTGKTQHKPIVIDLTQEPDEASSSSSSPAVEVASAALAVQAEHKYEKILGEHNGCTLVQQSNGVRVLKLDAKSPQDAGEAHGYLLGQEINEGIETFIEQEIVKLLPLAKALIEHIGVHSVFNTSIKTPMQKVLEHIPEDIRTEMEGIVVGYNRYLDENDSEKEKLSLEMLTFMQCLPDSIHYNPLTSIAANVATGMLSGIFGKVGCTTIVHGDKAADTSHVGRNLDWEPIGEWTEKSSLVIARNGVASISWPGMVGTTTGQNQHGVFAAINVCEPYKGKMTESPMGPPSAILTRMMLEQSPTTTEAAAFFDQQQSLGPIHVTVATHTHAFAQHFFQAEEGTAHHRREWKLGDKAPLITLNYRYELQTDGTVQPEEDFFDSNLRQKALDKYFTLKGRRQPTAEQLIHRALRLRDVNTDITLHSVRANLKTGQATAAFASRKAASKRMHEIDFEAAFAPLKA